MHRQLWSRLFEFEAQSGAAALVPSPDAMRRVLDRVGALHAAGVPLLAGSDAPNPGTSAARACTASSSSWCGPASPRSRRSAPPPPPGDITALVCDARGEGAAYRVLAFAESLGPTPATIEFAVEAARLALTKGWL